jgi:hypothetical protein
MRLYAGLRWGRFARVGEQSVRQSSIYGRQNSPRLVVGLFSAPMAIVVRIASRGVRRGHIGGREFLLPLPLEGAGYE